MMNFSIRRGWILLIFALLLLLLGVFLKSFLLKENGNNEQHPNQDLRHLPVSADSLMGSNEIEMSLKAGTLPTNEVGGFSIEEVQIRIEELTAQYSSSRNKEERDEIRRQINLLMSVYNSRTLPVVLSELEQQSSSIGTN